jgi:hypothetical protein
MMAALALQVAWAGSAPVCHHQDAGGLRLALVQASDGIRPASLFDIGRRQELLASNAPPLFEVTLREAGTTNETRLKSDAGWRKTDVRQTRDGFELAWQEPQEHALEGIRVKARAAAHARESAWHWQFQVENRNTNWSVWRVVFPQIALAQPGQPAAVLFPRGPGEVQTNIWERAFTYRGNYPSGWCSMQFMAAYGTGAEPTGLYLAVHDPWGSTKDLGLESDPAAHSVRMRFDHPAPDMGRAGNGFSLGGEAVWRLLRGDWFDAAGFYKSWAKERARWWPRLTREGRADTPQWMRKLNVWALGGGAPAECVTNVTQFREFLSLPAGFHWYNWHQIPFDNDYPHYFPAKDGFAQGVAQLKQAGVFVMPYINGRLWDTLDRGAEDFEFSSRARAAASKREDGQPYLESYGSKETNGQPVRLAAMCPTTALWQQTVRETVLRLLEGIGTSAVYIDQVAAASPTLCMDPSHGHPLGGGHWWNEGYWHMLDTIRQAMPSEAMLTTECNGEPFVRWFDGYLTWHWQHDGQVPAFPAVYGGAIQMFGRAYRGGATKDLALRMKAGQQLVFGEQLGWIDPGVAKEKQNADFFRQAVQLRSQFSRYFYAGEMARPPQLEGHIPVVKADWQWSGEWWVSTPSVLTGAWQIPAEKRLLLLFVNVSDEPVTATLRFSAKACGTSAARFRAGPVPSAASPSKLVALPGSFVRPLDFPPRLAQAWELQW